jgi:CheY-like chemotaxis protein
MADVLSADGHDVKCVAHGAEVLAFLEQRPSFDLILSDLTLPAMRACSSTGRSAADGRISRRG